MGGGGGGEVVVGKWRKLYLNNNKKSELVIYMIMCLHCEILHIIQKHNVLLWKDVLNLSILGEK